MSFRHDKIIKSKKKPCRCQWCRETILSGEGAICVSGVSDGDFWSGHFHFECWRAEHWWWKDSDNRFDECWPEDPMGRGSSKYRDENYQAEFRSDPVTPEELANPHAHALRMKLTPA